MKIIALTQRLFLNNSYYEMREALDVNWGAFLQTCGFLPLPLSIKVDFKRYFSEYKVSGIILTGGNDLKIFYNEETSEIRDRYETDIVNYAIKNQIPILGVCRGMQIIGNIFGSEISKITSHTGTRHDIKIVNKSRYSNALNNFSNVNSYHNYTLKTVPGALNVLAQSDDGAIESIEHAEHKILAFMWHPEREAPFKTNDIMLIKEFFI